MKYFFDTEFIEGFHKPLFGKRRHFIDLISIGIVCEDGREYYAISNEYKFKDADEWVQNNVIIPMYTQEIHGDKRNHMDAETFHKYTEKSKFNKQIAEEIKKFVFVGEITNFDIKNPNTEIEFYGYYSDYDWVIFCSLFGRMIDLPKGFPMYCGDLKQMLDVKSKRYSILDDKNLMVEFEGVMPEENIKLHPRYPKQENEHNALADAKWNKKLYEFLISI